MSDKREVRLIDANALCEILEAKADMALVPEYKHAFLNVQAMVNAMPSIDAEPVRHGRWVELGYACGETEWACTSCANTEWRTSASRLKWCPNCGAKMDGGEDDENA